MEFTEFGIKSEIIDALNKLDILEATDIQQLAIPPMMEGLDVIGQAQTGTGKTFAYSIPMIERIDVGNANIQGLILCPTRELGIQVSVEVKKLIAGLGKIKVATVYGGESYDKQIRLIKQRPQIIIGTPGRIIDLMDRGVLNFKYLRMLVLDEADEMLKMGFQSDIETILATTPSTRQTALFSATMPPFIKHVAENYQTSPVHVKVEAKTLTVDSIDQYVYFIKKEDKKNLLIRLLDLHEFRSVIIFANTKSMVDELVLFLQKNKYLVDGLHGDLKQQVRDRVMNGFRTNTINILIATDVAARGIDVSDVDAVINYDIPLEDEIYVHRIGRTGRAGKTGLSYTFASPREQYKVKEIEKFTNSKMKEIDIPSIKDIEKNYINKLENRLKSVMPATEMNDAYYTLANKFIAEGLSLDDFSKAMLKLLLEKSEREYPEIEVYKRNQEKKNDRKKDKFAKKGKEAYTRLGDNFNNKKGRKRKVKAKINLGKDDNFRPQSIINLCHDLAGVHKEHFGEVLVEKNQTLLEINEEGVRFLKQLSNKKVNGKKVVVKIIDK